MAWIEDISYISPDFKLEIPRWDFKDSGISCVFGESGSGKTTFLQIMAGLIPSRHKLCVKGEMLSDLPPQSRNIGFVFQDYALFPHMTAFQNLSFAAEAKGLLKAEWESHGQNLIKKLDLESLLFKRADTLSGGEQQRVALARALVTKPKLVLLDEPLSALDEVRRDAARSLIHELSVEFAVPFILVTHDFRDVRLLSQDIIFLDNGRVLGAGSTPQLLGNPSSLDLAKANPENQIFAYESSLNLDFSKTIEYSGGGSLVVVKNWTFTLSRPSENSRSIAGTVLSTYNEGPYLSCQVRLSSGQIIKAMAPLNVTPKGKVELYYDPSDLVLFKGLNN